MGLLYIDTNKPQDVAFVKTARKCFDGLTKKDITVDKLNIKAQGIICRPSERDFKYIVSNNMIHNFPITDSDITNTHIMFAQNLSRFCCTVLRPEPERF